MKVLADYMRAKSLKQTELASLIGVSQGQLNNWLNGRRKPKVASLKRIAEKTGLSLNKLVRES